MPSGYKALQMRKIPMLMESRFLTLDLIELDKTKHECYCNVNSVG